MAALRSVPVLQVVDDCSPDLEKETRSLFDRSGQHVPVRRRSIDDQNNRLTVKNMPIRKSTSQQSLTQLQSNIIKSFGQKIRKTKAELDRSGWIHAFYIFVLLIYSAIGGLLFMTLDGEASDETLAKHSNRCTDEKERLWAELMQNCTNLSFVDCSEESRKMFDWLDKCLREAGPQITVYSTNVYTNSLIYAITVYTTIGYGTILVSSPGGQVATIVYTIIGTPLFFAFLNDMGQWFQRLFLMVYFKLRRFIKNRSSFCDYFLKPSSRKLSVGVDMGTKNRKMSVFDDDDDRSTKPGLIFTCAVIFLMLYLVIVTLIFYFMEEWGFFGSFYFLFTSISLIGFGDYFPREPASLLFTILFIIVGISLLSMCFFILQEWIRKNTSKLSRRVRSSVRQWRSTHPFPVMYHQNRSSAKNSNRSTDVNCNLDLDNGNCINGGGGPSPTSPNKRFAPPRRCSSTDTILGVGKTTNAVGADDKSLSSKLNNKRKTLREFGRSQSSMNFFFRQNSFKLKKAGGSGGGKSIVVNRFQFAPSKSKTETFSDDEIS